MANVDLGPKGKAKGPRGRRTKKRLNVRIDMTPMVDVVMLLITFFMLATVFTTPQTMEINIPPDESKVEVAESNLMTLRVDAGGDIFWNMGMEPPKPVEFKDLRSMLTTGLKSNPKLIILVKVQREGTYGKMIDIMDELNLAQIDRFSLAPFTDYDKEEIAKVKG
ncbi:biopolymer transporter ExbD [bacterium]|nr:biopolymer transporter ExbD [bacterium]